MLLHEGAFVVDPLKNKWQKNTLRGSLRRPLKPPLLDIVRDLVVDNP